jgi:hypothetical protein
VQWLKFAGFIVAGVLSFAALLAAASDEADTYRRDPPETADHIITGTAVHGVDAVEESTCLAIPEADELVVFPPPDHFAVVVKGGSAVARSVTDCLRAGLAEAVKSSPL